MKRIVFCLLALAAFSACGPRDPYTLGNDDVRLTFSPETGALVSLFNVREGIEHLDSALAARQPLWSFDYLPGRPEATLPTEVSFHRKGRRTLEIRWDQPSGVSGPSVRVEVCLRKERPGLAQWRLETTGLDGLGVKSVCFPKVGGILRQGEEDALVYASWTGTLVRDPWSYIEGDKPFTVKRTGPGDHGMQVDALYNPQGSGLFLGTEDTASYYKECRFVFEKAAATLSQTHVLRIDADTSAYAMPYASILGTFRGDWVTAASLYRAWGTKQWWCRDSRFKNGQVPQWVLETALWVWNRGRSENVLPEAVRLKERLGLPVNAWWHWWHGCSYDDGFPEYIPPREGRERFIQAVADARAKGVHCINYMNSIQWGDSTRSWRERGADQWCARTEDGGTYAHVYNIFSGKSITPMCPATEFWRKTYTDLCDTVINAYGCGGVYMDQACKSKPCYNPAHGHSVGGGNSWVKGHLQLIDDIRAAIASAPGEPILAGEGSGEEWMGRLDLELTLEAANDRVRTAAYERVPFFHAVYHDYQVTFGNMSLLVSPPYDEKWPAEWRPSDAETTLPDDFDLQFMMEQAKTFVWGIQPCIANFHDFLFEEKPEAMGFLCDMVRTRYRALDYLLYGSFARCPALPEFAQEIPISRLKTYVKGGDRVKRFSRVVPTLYGGAWKAPDGSLGIALANISSEERAFSFALDPAAYALPSQGEIRLVTAEEDAVPLQAYAGKTEVDVRLPERSTAVLVIR